MEAHATRLRRPAALATATASCALLLGACGSSGDKAQITQIIKSYGLQPTKLCTQYATATMIRQQFATEQRCMQLASAPGARDPYVKVHSVTVNGNTAVAIRTSGSNPGKGTQAKLEFVKTSQGWKVSAVLPYP